MRLSTGRGAGSSPSAVLAGGSDTCWWSTPADDKFAGTGRLVELPLGERTHIRRDDINDHIDIDYSLGPFLSDLGNRKALDERTEILRRATDEIRIQHIGRHRSVRPR